MSDAQEINVPQQAPNGQVVNGTFNGTPDGQARVNRTSTAYNWVELVYEAFGRKLPKEANAVALLCIREARVGGSGDHKAREQAAANRTDVAPLQGSADRQATSPAAGSTYSVQRTANTSNVSFDDLLYLVWTDSTAEKKQCAEVFRCTADPGMRGARHGTARQVEGFHYACKPTQHQARKYPGGINALRIFNEAATSDIRVARDATGRYNIYTNFESAQVGPTWCFCKDEPHDSVGINMHFGAKTTSGRMETDKVGGWSIGCTTLAWGRGSARYKTDFLKRCTDAPNKNLIPYMVVSSKYVKVYDRWAQEAGRGGARDAASVILRDGLVAMPEGYTGYVPSIATKGFCEEVARRAAQMGMGPYRVKKEQDAQWGRAAGLRSALQNLAITTLAV